MAKDKTKVKTFELIKGLFITPDNYKAFNDRFDKAVRKGKEEFAFPNHKGEVFAIKVEYVKFAISMMEKMGSEAKWIEFIEELIEKDRTEQLILSGVVVPKGTLGCGCNNPYPKYLHAKEKTKCMNCRAEY